MAVTVTSLTHPTMIAKLRMALFYASKGQGHMMEGHGKRCYIQNAQGRNIMRLDWVGGKEGYIVYGQESRNITATVKAAFRVDFNRRTGLKTNPKLLQDSYKASHPVTKAWPKLAAVVALTSVLGGCNAPGFMAGVLSLLC